MARIRTIKPDFWSNEKVLECKPLTRLLFIGMWNFADDYGRLPFSPKSIKAQIFPADEMSVADVRDMLVELSSNGLVLIYAVDNREYIEIIGWGHQRIDRKGEPKCPAPFVDGSANVQRTIAPDLTVSKGNGAEGRQAEAPARTIALQEEKPKPLHADWHPDARDVDEAHNAGLTDDEIDRLAKRFGAHYRARGEKRVDWNEQWKSWCLDEGAKKPKAISDEPAEPVNWDKAVSFYAKTSKWWKDIGPEPGQAGCRAPLELLRKHNLVANELAQ